MKYRLQNGVRDDLLNPWLSIVRQLFDEFKCLRKPFVFFVNSKLLDQVGSEHVSEHCVTPCVRLPCDSLAVACRQLGEAFEQGCGELVPRDAHNSSHRLTCY